MKRFLVFGARNHKQRFGGWLDFFADFDSAEAADSEAKMMGFVWWQVVDLQERVMVSAWRAEVEGPTFRREPEPLPSGSLP
jgi:hypothetical protein